MDNSADFEDLPEPPSKSELKRRQLSVQDLIAQIISLPQLQIEALPAEDNCLRQLKIAAAMSPSSALNRQIRHIAKLVSKQPGLITAFTDIIENTQAQKQEQAAQLHELEYWRNRILQGSDTEVFEFSQQFNHPDPQQLRQLRREYQKADSGEQKGKDKQKEIARKLFKLLSVSVKNAGE